MNDDTDKLAAEMKNLRPSEAARNSGMNAALAAFDMEFAPENITQKTEGKEKISNTPQGFTGDPRPTGQSTFTKRVQTIGRHAMKTVDTIFNIQPKTAMMMGSCAVALFAASLYLPNMAFENMPSKPISKVAAIELDRPNAPLQSSAESKAATQETPSKVQLAKLPPELATNPAPPIEAPAAAQGSKIQKNSAKIRSQDIKREAESHRLREQNRALAQRRAQQAFAVPMPNSPAQNSSSIKTQLSADNRFEEIPAEFKTETKTIITKEDSIELVRTPPVYETVSEMIVTQAGSTEFITIPPTYNADGTIATPASVQERVIPSAPKMVSRRVIKTPASTTERIVPAGTEKEVHIRTIVTPAKFYLRDEHGKIIHEFETRDQFEKYKLNQTKLVADAPVSTFSIDVDTASYSFMRASLNRGQLPLPNSIRLEEMINYFPYDYKAPTSSDEPFRANVTVSPTPWNADTKLMHIGIKGYVPPAKEKPRSNLVFLIDTSGSMNSANKLPLLINSFKLLLNTLDEDDTVSIVSYAGHAGTVLEPTPISDKNKIKEALTRLRAGGSTAGAAGLELAYQKAEQGFDKAATNRVILATDGDFNVGFSSPDEMKEFVAKKRKTGVFLSVLGFGHGNYNDHLMQALAQNGNGVAAYIDTLSEANKVLANEAGSALLTIAKDVKIQVEFNPETISEYRLIGYETRALKREDFNNDKVDAGEINAGHTVTAIYELTPVDSPAKVFDPLRYVDKKLKGTGSDELAFVKIRHKLPNSDTSTLQTFPIGPRQERNLDRASDDMRFSIAVAAVGQKLRGDTQVEDFSYKEAIKLASSAKGDDVNGYRAEFIQLARLAETLQE